jgi:hypothetical protein
MGQDNFLQSEYSWFVNSGGSQNSEEKGLTNDGVELSVIWSSSESIDLTMEKDGIEINPGSELTMPMPASPNPTPDLQSQDITLVDSNLIPQTPEKSNITPGACKGDKSSGTSVPVKDSTKVLEAMAALSIMVKKQNLEPILLGWLFLMQSFLQYFNDKDLGLNWTYASLLAAKGAGRGVFCAQQVRAWTLTFLSTHKLPIFGWHNIKSLLVEHEGLSQELQLHIQSLGKFFTAMDVVCYIAQPDVMARLGISIAISERTACQWLNAMSYRFGKIKNGMYVDGHEREDIVRYRQEEFLPRWIELEWHMFLREKDGNVLTLPCLLEGENQIILITHDESVFYGADQHKTRWIHSSETAKPVRKGEGTSIMVSDFCSPEFGWLE